MLTEVFVDFIEGAGADYLFFTPSTWLKVLVAYGADVLLRVK